MSRRVLLIPYEDFMVIGEQLVYLYNQDWENFDPTALAFASLGAATIIPIAKPLKPLLAPLKKMVDGMKRFPGARHFAGAIGTATKAGLSGKTEKLADLLPFILIAIELFKDDEVFTFLMNAIKSEEDFWVWAEYIAEVVRVEGGLDALATKSEEQVTVNPLSFFIATAHAKSKKDIGDKLIPRIRELTKSFDVKDAHKVSAALRDILKDPQLKTIAASGKSALRLFAAVGGVKISKFVRDSKNWRVNRWLVMFSMVYLIEEYDDEQLKLKSESQLTSLITNLFSKNISNSNGAVFQIVQTAYFHARYRAAPATEPKVIGIDAVRAANYLKAGLVSGNAYERQVDIVLEYPTADKMEEWVELKSYSSSTIGNSVKPSDKVYPGKSGHSVLREFFHDYRLNDDFITSDSVNKSKILLIKGKTTKTNKIFTWYYQDFDSPAGKGTGTIGKGTSNKGHGPSTKQIENIRIKFCKKPKDFKVKDYAYNFGKTRKAVEKKCLEKAETQVGLRNTRSYFTEVLDIIGNDFALTVKQELLGRE